MKLYYCIEDGNIVTEETLRSEWMEEKQLDHFMTDTFTAFLECCSYRNNGSLQTITERITYLRRTIARKESIVDEYGEYGIDDELYNLRSELSELTRLYSET